MAIFKNSTFGSIRKSIGDDVAYRSGGQNIVRKKPAQVNDARSDSQIYQRTLFTKMVSLFRALSSIVKLNFGERLALHSAYNVFMSENIRNATAVINYTATILWDKILVSKGTLPVVSGSTFADNDDGTCTLTLPNQVDGNQLVAGDKRKIVLINQNSPAKSSLITGEANAVYNQTLAPVNAEDGDTIHVYAFHTTSNFAKSSDSVYLGSFEV